MGSGMGVFLRNRSHVYVHDIRKTYVPEEKEYEEFFY